VFRIKGADAMGYVDRVIKVIDLKINSKLLKEQKSKDILLDTNNLQCLMPKNSDLASLSYQKTPFDWLKNGSEEILYGSLGQTQGNMGIYEFEGSKL